MLNPLLLPVVQVQVVLSPMYYMIHLLTLPVPVHL